MVRLYLLVSVLVLEKLAEHLLLELATLRVLSDSIDNGSYEEEDQVWMWDMSTWSEDEVKGMEGHIAILMDATGEPSSEEDYRVNTYRNFSQCSLSLVPKAGRRGSNVVSSCVQNYPSWGPSPRWSSCPLQEGHVL